MHYPWTHSLAVVIAWSVLFGLACLKCGKREAPILGLLVLSPMIAAGARIYARSAPSRDRIGTWSYRGLIAFLVLAYLGNVLGPPPPSVQAIAVAGIVGSVLFTAWGWWSDRHRGDSAAIR